MLQVYLDSCILIYLLQGPPDLRQRIREALKPAPEGKVQPMVSVLTRLECRVGPLRQGNPRLLGQYDAILSSSDLRYIPLTAGLFDRATELRARHGLKTPDAIHLAAALEAPCEELWTHDHRLAKAAGRKIRIRVLG